MNRVTAIDGPSASGKSTVARRVAKACSALYVDSGALYRGVTWHTISEGVNTTETESVIDCLRRAPIEFFVQDGAVRYRIDGIEPVEQIRSVQVTENVSRVAAIPEVRQQVNDWLRSMRQFGPLVVEGRDIGTAVFPDAANKFYLDASPEERARRRFTEITPHETSLSQTDVAVSIQRRDTMDRTRKRDPLKVATDAVVIDSTGMSIEQVADTIIRQLS
jgi:cytidylate kinase